MTCPDDIKGQASFQLYLALTFCQDIVCFWMKMAEKTYEEREMILELFPGTSPELLPPGEVLYYRDKGGRVHISEAPLGLVLEPLEPFSSTAPIICEACLRHVSRSAAEFFRFGVGKNQRHFRYLALCRDTDTCAGAARPERLREILFRGILP
jgi:hypothetical protein